MEMEGEQAPTGESSGRNGVAGNQRGRSEGGDGEGGAATMVEAAAETEATEMGAMETVAAGTQAMKSASQRREEEAVAETDGPYGFDLEQIWPSPNTDHGAHAHTLQMVGIANFKRTIRNKNCCKLLDGYTETYTTNQRG